LRDEKYINLKINYDIFLTLVWFCVRELQTQIENMKHEFIDQINV